MTPKVQLRIQLIARMSLAGVSDKAIQETYGLSASGLARIKALPEYRDEWDKLATGSVTKLDEALAGQQEQQKQVMRVAVPMALRTLVETVAQRRDLRASLLAAKEILNRDPDKTFAETRAGAGDNPSAVTSLPHAILEDVKRETGKIIGVIQTPAQA